eukprot:TRINITY_DN3473_c0_g1_i4.p1 TRINITY_DN3473_c0_g1~~TRINITY_DN3473_c0_g1_i4.p1  ORF type:complete len:551 (-),score=124.31 TRINITY_DN3473_c0_g1_i4:9-1466(-)
MGNNNSNNNSSSSSDSSAHDRPPSPVSSSFSAPLEMMSVEPHYVKLPFEEGDDKWSRITKALSQRIPDPEALDATFEELNFGTSNASNIMPFFKQYFNMPDHKVDRTRFFETALPRIQQLVLDMPTIFKEKIPLLYPQMCGRVVLTPLQAACLLSSSFFGALSPSRGNSQYIFPSCDLSQLWGVSTILGLPQGEVRGPAGIAECILHYFDRITERTDDELQQRRIVFERHVLPQGIDWRKSERVVTPATVHLEGTIEDSDAQIHADFANQYLGGGVLSGGCVQEEILFGIKPESLVGMLFCAKMEPNESISISNAEQFATYTGYGRKVKFGKPFLDTKQNVKIVAMDAVVSQVKSIQWSRASIVRDLHKAYIAFANNTSSSGTEDTTTTTTQTVATGHWGCGAFGGDKQLKFIEQLMAASEAGCRLAYYAFGEKDICDQMQQIQTYLHDRNVTVGTLYACTREYGDRVLNDKSEGDLFEFIRSHF